MSASRMMRVPMLPSKLWLVLFAVGTCVLLYRGIIDPIWAALGACYFYFAIPPIEFAAPEGIPYQAAFWALAIGGSLRYRTLLRDDARKEIEDAGLASARGALNAARDTLKRTIVDTAAQVVAFGQIRSAALAAAETPAFEAVDATSPREIVLAVRRGVFRVLEEAAELGEKESLKIADNVGRATRGTLRSALELRVGPVVDELIDARVEEHVLREVRRTIDDGEAARDRASTAGPLGIPMPRGPLTGLLSNAGLWLHITFTVITYFGALNAQYDVYKAMRKFDTCYLLFIPVVAIICSVRDARHVRLFTFAWIAGSFHLAMNGVTWWLQNGGRADNPGGQGGESNFLGAVIATIAPVTFGMILNSKTWIMRGANVALAAIFTLGILASGSRAALIAFVVSGGYWLLHTNRKGFALGGALIAAGCFLVVAPTEFWERMGTILGEKDRNPWVVAQVEESKHERQVLWALAIDVWEKNPFWGIGPGQYNFVSAEQTDFTDPYQQQRGLQTHNTWLQLAAEYGTIGTGVWAGAFLYGIICYGRARRRLKRYPGWEWFSALCLGLEAGAIANAITCTFNSFQWYDYHYWFFVFAPLVLQVAKETADRLEWMKPIDAEVVRPPPRYGPPEVEGLDVAGIDLSEVAPVQRTS